MCRGLAYDAIVSLEAAEVERAATIVSLLPE
jgi:hypothetical protein